jgi:hypothetical protein
MGRSGTVIELEALARRDLTTANLWRSLRTFAAHRGDLEVGELHRLVQRATDQLARVIAAHDVVAEHAFVEADRLVLADIGVAS